MLEQRLTIEKIVENERKKKMFTRLVEKQDIDRRTIQRSKR